MNRRRHLAAMLCSALACSSAEPAAGDDPSTSTSTGVPATTGGAGSSGTGAPTTGDVSTGEPGSTTSSSTGPEPTGFIAQPDGGAAGDECSTAAQDCPPGQKCTWWSGTDGSGWNDTKCVPVADDPAQLGEPCIAEGGGASGIDDCDVGLMCWDVDARGDGRCAALCTGSADNPTCPPGQVCAVGGDIFALCFQTCDPLAQDCPFDDLCLPHNYYTFLCTLDASGAQGQLHDPCEWENTCDPGLLCVSPAAAVECDQTREGCCEPMCDLTKPNTCPGAGQTCQPLYEPQPQGFEHVGYCSVPQ